MVAEGIIALIWAAAAMAYFKVDTADGWSALNKLGGDSTTVYAICTGLLGPAGTVLAVIGVVICPITSGDTALRSCRLIIGESFKLDPKKLKTRLMLTIPLFAAVVGLSLWNFADKDNFNILWRWFAWSNQMLAAVSLWVATGYLYKTARKRLLTLFTAIPALFMTDVVVTYILAEPNLALGRFIPYAIAVPVGAGITALIAGFYAFLLIRRKDSSLLIDAPAEEAPTEETKPQE